MPDRQLDGVAVEHLEPSQLGAIDLGREPDRIDRPPHEHRLARRMLDHQRRLAQPPRHRPATVRKLAVDEKQRHQSLPAPVAHEPANHHLRLGRIGRERGQGTRSSDLDRLGTAALAPTPDALRLAVTIEPLLARRLRVRAPRRPDTQLLAVAIERERQPERRRHQLVERRRTILRSAVLALVGHDPAVGQIILGQRIERDRVVVLIATAGRRCRQRRPKPKPRRQHPQHVAVDRRLRQLLLRARRSARSDRRGSTPRARRAARAATSSAATQTPSSSIAIDPAGAALRLPFAFGLPCSPCATSSA